MRLRSIGIVVQLAAFLSPRQAFGGDQASARQLFFTTSQESPAPGGTKRPASTKTISRQAPALRYTIELLDLNMKPREVDSDTVFATGNRIRLVLTPNVNGFLYVAHRGSSGIWSILYPKAVVQRAEAMRPVRVPSADCLEFVEPAGRESVIVVLSQSPAPDLDRLLDSLSKGTHPGGPAVSDNEIALLKEEHPSRDLRVQKVTPEQGQPVPEHAVYFANASNGATDLIAEINLSHR